MNPLLGGRVRLHHSSKVMVSVLLVHGMMGPIAHFFPSHFALHRQSLSSHSEHNIAQPVLSLCVVSFVIACMCFWVHACASKCAHELASVLDNLCAYVYLCVCFCARLYAFLRACVLACVHLCLTCMIVSGLSLHPARHARKYPLTSQALPTRCPCMI